MKRVPSLIFSFAAVAALACAQDKVTVPLSSPGQPATLKARLITGSITVTAGNINVVTLAGNLKLGPTNAAALSAVGNVVNATAPTAS